MIDLFYNTFYFFYLFLFVSFFCCWGGLGYIFGCDLISYVLILLSLWNCFLMVLAKESVFRLRYFSGFFSLLLLSLLLCCTVLLEELVCFLFTYFFEIRLIPTLYLILGCGYQPDRPLPRLSGHSVPTQPWQRPVTIWAYKPEAASAV